MRTMEKNRIKELSQGEMEKIQGGALLSAEIVIIGTVLVNTDNPNRNSQIVADQKTIIGGFKSLSGMD